VSYALVCLLAFPSNPAAAGQHTYAPPERALPGSVPQPPLSDASPAAAGFQLRQEIAHQDDFWANMLTGDADHDGLQEIVLRHVTSGTGGTQRIEFYEDDGTGHFSRVYAFDLQDGGLLAMGDIDGDGLTDLFYERALGSCQHQFVRRESSSHFGFPDHEVWTAPKQGNVVDFRAVLADSDGDGLQELITTDDNFSCQPTSLKVFESAPNDQLTLVWNPTINGELGNPVVADFDQNGKREIAVAEMFAGQLLLFESNANDSWTQLPATPHTLYNAYQCALVERFSPTGYPLLYLVGQVGSLDYRVQCFARPGGAPALQLQNETLLPGLCGASIPQIAAADLTGSRAPEIFVDRICGPVPVYSIGPGGVLTLLDAPNVSESIEVVGTRKTALHSGALVVGRSFTAADLAGKTWVLEQ
jgi:hypothetical protein